MWKLSLLLFCFAIPVIAAEKMSAPQLIDLAKSHGAGLRDAITSSFDAKDLKEGVAIGSKSLDSGAAAARLKHLIAVSNA